MVMMIMMMMDDDDDDGDGDVRSKNVKNIGSEDQRYLGFALSQLE
jgi:hypothetical protein